jgi:hypothetical protein
MIRLVYSPQWFYGKDIIIDVVAIFVLTLIAIFALKFYKIDRTNKNYLYIAVSFILMSVAFLFKIMTNFTIYYLVQEVERIGFITVAYPEFEPTETLFFIGFLVYRILTLFGLYLLFAIYQKQQKQTIFFIIYLIMISTYFTQQAYYVFHITSLILLALIVMQYFRNYKENKHSTTRLLGYSFSLIALSQVIFIFAGLNSLLYVTAEIVQLAGYIALLFTFFRVLKHGKKKR